jgi:hypothetical protein
MTDMERQHGDPLRGIAEQVADCFAARGYAFVEDDRIDSLAAALRDFLAGAGIPVHAGGSGQGAQRAGIVRASAGTR